MAQERVPSGGATGWDWFSRVEQGVADAREDAGEGGRDDIALVYHRLFSTPDGQVILRDLRRFREMVSFDPAMGFYNGAAFGFYRTGLATMVNFIEAKIRRGTMVE